MKPSGILPASLLAALLAILTVDAVSASDWPQIMGPDRDGTVSEPAPKQLPEELAPVFTRDVGAGFAGPVVSGELLILFHRQGNEEIVEALDRTNGETRWRSAYRTSYRDDFGFDEGPRAPATVHGNRVVTHGAQGRLSVFDLSNGRLLWQIDTMAAFEVEKGFFGAASAPLVVKGSDDVERVLLNVGGKGAGVVAFNLANGSVSWQVTDDGASYSSPVPFARNGKPGAAFFTRNGLLTLDATTGDVWSTAAWRSRLRSSVNASLPAFLDDNRVLLTASYGTGAVLLDLGSESPEQVWTSKESLACHYAPVVVQDGVLFGIHGRAEYGGELRAVDGMTGRVLWSEDTGGGSVLAVGDVLVVLLDSGELRLVEANRAAYRELGRAELFDSTTRALPAYSNGVLYARDSKRLAAWKLR